MARRTNEHNLRQATSEILEQIYAIEYAMGLFYRNGSERELARAQDDFETMRAAVDRLGHLVAHPVMRKNRLCPKLLRQPGRAGRP
jgi:hypothetical protein